MKPDHCLIHPEIKIGSYESEVTSEGIFMIPSVCRRNDKTKVCRQCGYR